MNLKSLNICQMFKFKCYYFTKTFRYYSTRNNNKSIAPKCSMRKSEISINFKSIKVWNKLPADIRKSDALNVFMDPNQKFIVEATLRMVGNR